MKNMKQKALAAAMLMVMSGAAMAAEGDGTQIFTEIGVTVGLLSAAAMVLTLAVQKPLVIIKLVKKFVGRST